MKKILLAFDGTNFSEGAFEFAKRMNEQSPILVVGVFLPQINYANVWSYAEGVAGSLFIPLLEKEDTIAVQKNIAEFESLCQKNNMEYRTHRNFSDFALPMLKKETRFADLLIIGSESFYENLGINQPNESLKDTLHDSECPVLVVPEIFEFPESNILTYNGTDDSVYAIRQFTYLFPELCKNKTLLVYAKEEHEKEFPDVVYIEELAARHFPDLTLFRLPANPKQFFHKWASEKKASVLISGAFNRSIFSHMFKKSFVADVIRDHKLPVFVAHR
ncbi:MAG: universal stress protein [Chitinophagales bacterium]